MSLLPVRRTFLDEGRDALPHHLDALGVAVRTQAVAIGKEAFYKQALMPLDEAYAYTGQVMAENMLLKDTAEGIAAFIEKRPPDWQQ